MQIPARGIHGNGSDVEAVEVAPVVLGDGDGAVGVDSGDVGDVADRAGAVAPAVPLGHVPDVRGGVDVGGGPLVGVARKSGSLVCARPSVRTAQAAKETHSPW